MSTAHWNPCWVVQLRLGENPFRVRKEKRPKRMLELWRQLFMNQLALILYICDSCRKIRKFDVSMAKIEREGNLYKVRDVHADHEAILYLNHQYTLKRVILNPSALPMKEPIIKEPSLVEEVPIGPFKGVNRIFIPTIDPKQIPVQIELHKLIVLNMNGVNTLMDLYEGLSPDWPELTPVNNRFS